MNDPDDWEFDVVTCIEAMRKEMEWEIEQNRRERMNEICTPHENTTWKMNGDRGNTSF